MPQTQKTVLIIEDDADIRESMLQALEIEGFRAVGAENGRVALELMTQGLRPNLILLDLMMPVMSGWQFYEVKNANPELAGIPMLVISAVGSKAEELPAQGFLKKPIDLDELITAVKRHSL